MSKNGMKTRKKEKRPPFPKTEGFDLKTEMLREQYCNLSRQKC